MHDQLVGSGKLKIIVINKGKFVTLIKNKSLHPRKGWWVARYKGEFYPVFWNAVGKECIEIGKPTS